LESRAWTEVWEDEVAVVHLSDVPAAGLRDFHSEPDAAGDAARVRWTLTLVRVWGTGEVVGRKGGTAESEGTTEAEGKSWGVCATFRRLWGRKLGVRPAKR